MNRNSLNAGIQGGLGAALVAGWIALVVISMFGANVRHSLDGTLALDDLPGLPRLPIVAAIVQDTDPESLDQKTEELEIELSLIPPIWRTWETQHRGEARRITFRATPALQVPGMAVGLIQLSDGLGNLLGEWEFWPGPDVDFYKVSFRHDAIRGIDIIVIPDAGPVDLHDIGKQFFAFSDDTLYCIRLEDSGRHLLQNRYNGYGASIGVLPDARTESEWIELLESGDTVRVLAALTYLGGQFGRKPRRVSDDRAPDEQPIVAISVLRQNPRIRDLVAIHQHSEIDWIREAAGMAVAQME